jgi:hypothetical protein
MDTGLFPIYLTYYVQATKYALVKLNFVSGYVLLLGAGYRPADKAATINPLL